jgi:hypothetical protein
LAAFTSIRGCRPETLSVGLAQDLAAAAWRSQACRQAHASSPSQG